jgi:citronellol/citronellal dehydrogenase
MSVLRPDANAGRVALVTGGGTGIGRATALAFARTGARVAICGRREEPLAEVEAEVTAGGGECLAVSTDVREPEAIDDLVERTLERFGAIDVVVNNAGGQFIAAAEEISPNGWRAVHRLAVDAAWNVTRTVAMRSMIPRRTGVVFFVGFSPRRGVPGMAHAAAARAAVENLAAGLAGEWSRYGIRAICVAPGTILTEGL